MCGAHFGHCVSFSFHSSGCFSSRGPRGCSNSKRHRERRPRGVLFSFNIKDTHAPHAQTARSLRGDSSMTATGSRHDRYPETAPTGTGDSSESRDTAAPPSFLSVYISRRPWPVASQYQSASLAVRMPKSKRSEKGSLGFTTVHKNNRNQVGRQFTEAVNTLTRLVFWFP